MATVRQYDGDNAIERWPHCDDTTATVRYDYRIVAPSARGLQQIEKGKKTENRVRLKSAVHHALVMVSHEGPDN
ncbi:hypothetical protein DPMN_013125 [Dreissena polymorpha]|uniref:Uncharacterized protein n=1 Tax=Dreissena polymorpha TaxID=45954 RepID=A0A9D4N9B9_DREPO|nr:hypothetical protein DPMN_013125 [Dreissena polymorpha]